jgi:site-specific recombinase XerD
MARVNFFLKRPAASKSVIVCNLSEGRKYQIKLYTGISINPKHWSKKHAVVLSADPNSASFNRALKDLERNVLKIYLEAKAKRILPDLEYFKRELQPQPEMDTALWGVFENYLISKKGTFKTQSLAKFNSLKKHLQGFERINKRPLTLDSITADTMEDFQNYLYYHEDDPDGQIKRPKKPLNTQSTEKYIGILKIFLNWCVKKKYTEFTDFRNFTPIKQPDSLKVIMTDGDIKKLNEANLEAKNYLKNVRALFLLACDTGLRYSDFSRINKQHLKQGQTGYNLEMRQTKTEDFVSIPIIGQTLQTVNDLIEGKIHAISNQKMNSYVKELCQLSGIDEPFEIHTYRGKQKTITTVPKYKLVTTHTGRRTFCTMLLNKGVAAQIVMRFSGHKDYKSFSKYVNIPKETEMQIVRDALTGNKDVDGNMWVA